MFDVMHSRATDRRSASKCQGKWPDQTLDHRAARAAGSHPHLASVLLQGRKSANIYASSGVIRGIPAECRRLEMTRRWSIIKWLLFAIAGLMAARASAQVAPSGEHYAGRASDTGYG